MVGLLNTSSSRIADIMTFIISVQIYKHVHHLVSHFTKLHTVKMQGHCSLSQDK